MCDDIWSFSERVKKRLMPCQQGQFVSDDRFEIGVVDLVGLRIDINPMVCNHEGGLHSRKFMDA